MISSFSRIFRLYGILRSIIKGKFDLNKLKTMDSNTISDVPLIVVLGETGVGKTKLAVELCRRFNGEVISADSMQIYEGLDIITNKVTPEEACGIPHHMISVLSPSKTNFNVQLFQHRALKLINEIWRHRCALPVVVGGTNYYVESLLWNRLVKSETDNSDQLGNDDIGGESGGAFTKDVPFRVDSMTDEQLHEELRKVDSATADRQHPKNRRKVIRSLQIFYRTGRPHSQWLFDQHSSCGASILGGTKRFHRVCVLWLTCEDRDVLKARLNSRVDEMVGRGLREEITSFFDRHYGDNSQRFGPDVTTKGIFQSIGLKEFEDFLKLPVSERSSEAGSNAFEEGLEKLKRVTAVYARKQHQWITNRFCRLAARDSVPVYCLDTTDVSKWSQGVSVPAANIVESFLADRKPDVSVKMATTSAKLGEPLLDNQFCEHCQRLISGLQWTAHVNSKAHRLRLYKERQALLLEAKTTSAT